MPSPIVSLPTLEQIVPEHCCPLWRNDTNATIYGNVQCTEKREESAEMCWNREDLAHKCIQAKSDLLQHNYNMLFLATLTKNTKCYIRYIQGNMPKDCSSS